MECHKECELVFPLSCIGHLRNEGRCSLQHDNSPVKIDWGEAGFKVAASVDGSLKLGR